MSFRLQLTTQLVAAERLHFHRQLKRQLRRSEAKDTYNNNNNNDNNNNDNSDNNNKNTNNNNNNNNNNNSSSIAEPAGTQAAFGSERARR